MILATDGHNFRYELENICRIYLPFEKITFSVFPPQGEAYVHTVCTRENSGFQLKVVLRLNAKTVRRETSTAEDGEAPGAECERLLCVLLLECFQALTGYKPPWGILTGVRPAKLYAKLADQMGRDAAMAYFSEKLLVTDEKIALCQAVSSYNRRMIDLSAPASFSLYVSIPFCPSRCHYCSFVSHSTQKAAHLIPDYLQCLLKEIEATGALARRYGLRCETVYVGGGTPTVLSAGQLSALLDKIAACFDLSCVREYTVEAGRPDTITAPRLRAIAAAGVNRLSVNPQSMSDAVLEAVGRRHTAAQTEQAVALAREAGFRNLNMDLIAGLPTDTPQNFARSLETICALGPENITVHTLAMKRASTLHVNHCFPNLESGAAATQMIEHSGRFLQRNGYLPYYMYRQSKTLGNLENVGYAREGFAGLYNVYMMEETHTILACGASAVTKLRRRRENIIKRIFNYKYPYEYITRFEDILSRKHEVVTFYEEYGV